MQPACRVLFQAGLLGRRRFWTIVDDLVNGVDRFSNARPAAQQKNTGEQMFGRIGRLTFNGTGSAENVLWWVYRFTAIKAEDDSAWRTDCFRAHVSTPIQRAGTGILG